MGDANDVQPTYATIQAAARLSKSAKLFRELQGRLYDVIKADDQSELERLIQTYPGNRTHLLNSPIVCSLRTGDVKPRLDFSRPLFVAAIFTRVSMVTFLLESGADLCRCEHVTVNVIHALCWAAANNPDREPRICEVYRKLVEIEGVQKFKTLLLANDSDGLRPLELASKLGTFLLLKEILETDGVYKMAVFQTAFERRVKYDFTDYESHGAGSRSLRNPLAFLRYIQDSDLQKDGCIDLFQNHPLLQKWIALRFHLTIPYLLIPCLSKLIMFVMFTFMDHGACVVSDESDHVHISEVSSTWPISMASALIYIVSLCMK
jgi:hypothetical protein